MFDKNLILIIIIILLALFYFVIRIGAGKKKDIENSKDLTKYLSSVRKLILILAVVGLILWFFI